MEETVPAIPIGVYHTLGKKTFILFLLDRIRVAVIFVILAVILFILSGQSFLDQKSIGDMRPYAMLGGEIMLAIAVLAFLIAFLVSWLVYRNYTFCLEDDALKIKRGVITKEEIAIPYRQIQDVDIQRGLDYQLLGMSRLDILTAGHEDTGVDGGTPDESEGILPGIDKDFAEALQAELLKRTDVQRVSEVKAS